MDDVVRPRLEGTVAVRDGRRLGFAEFGSPHGDAVIWMHGTPGARRQIPLEARAFADRERLRIIGVDRPGIGSSTPHVYRDIADWTDDLVLLADTLGIDTMRLIGLSGGGPYVLAAGAALPERVLGVAVIGGVAPSVGADAVGGGVVGFARHLAPFVSVARVPIGFVLTVGIRLSKPLAGRFLDAYALVQPEGDKRLLGRPEVKAMFVDDLLNGSRKQVTAPLSDLLLFSREWGFRVDGRQGARALVPRRRRPHRAVRPRRPRRRPAARRDDGGHGRREPSRGPRSRRGHPHRPDAPRHRLVRWCGGYGPLIT